MKEDTDSATRYNLQSMLRRRALRYLQLKGWSQEQIAEVSNTKRSLISQTLTNRPSVVSLSNEPYINMAMEEGMRLFLDKIGLLCINSEEYEQEYGAIRLLFYHIIIKEWLKVRNTTEGWSKERNRGFAYIDAIHEGITNFIISIENIGEREDDLGVILSELDNFYKKHISDDRK